MIVTQQQVVGKLQLSVLVAAMMVLVHILNTPVVMHVRGNYCNMETLHLVDVYIYIHCVIGKQCSVLDTWLRGATLRTPQPSGQMAAEYGVWWTHA